DPPASTKKVTIAVIPKGTTHEFWKSIHAGAVKASRDLGVEIIWKGPQREDDREMQIQVVEDFISRKVDGIVLAPLDDKALVRPVNDAMKRKIPVVIIDSGLQGKDYVSFVATDNYKGGELGGKRLAEVMGGKGKVILLRYQEGSASTMEREKGFLDAIKKFPDIKIMVFCPNESSTFGMLRALTDAGKAGKVKFVGFDSSEKLIQALKDGHIHGLVQQNPFKMGELGVKTIVARIRGEKIEAKIDTGVGVVTKENMDQPEISTLLHPPLDEYLK
ncbi:substrate-binding domain-containing protein, partial [Candidatus Sumerlaeota bacterium]|nr:substrate-binding domain-containing protein [Candidatus Sumerlaeota bacterium]